MSRSAYGVPVFGLVARSRGTAVALLAGLLLAGCAGTPVAGTAGATVDPATPTARSEEPGSVTLPWPAADAAALQAAVDAGSQPWLLEPTEVGRAYVAAAHGWDVADARPAPDGTSVDVSNGAGGRLTLSLAQPARPGGGGIWVVTAEQPG